MSYFGTMFSPTFVSKQFFTMGSKPFTIAFSNLPGLLSSITFGGKKTIKSYGYFIPAGKCGLAVSCLSYASFIKLTCTVDTAVMQNPRELMDLIEDNLKKCLKETEKAEVSESDTSYSPPKKKDQ